MLVEAEEEAAENESEGDDILRLGESDVSAEGEWSVCLCCEGDEGTFVENKHWEERGIKIPG